jgi:hypothetical protein
MKGLRITLAAGVAAALACTSLTASADEVSGLSAGLRLGYGFPFGNASSSTTLSDFSGGQAPFWFDLGWRFNRNLYLGAFYQYAITSPPSHLCGSGGGAAATCDGNDQRFGIDFAYHILPEQLADPWVGLGVGYEVARNNYTNSSSSDQHSIVVDGWQYIDIQAGLDLRFAKRVPFGPFVDFSFGQYNWAHGVGPNENPSGVCGGAGTVGSPGGCTIASSLHEWLTLGIRAQFNL